MMKTSDIAEQINSRLGSISLEDLLSGLGLEPRRSTAQMTASASGWFAAGLLVGAGLAMLLGPRLAEASGSVGYAGQEGSQPLTQM